MSHVDHFDLAFVLVVIGVMLALGFHTASTFIGIGIGWLIGDLIWGRS